MANIRSTMKSQVVIAGGRHQASISRCSWRSQARRGRRDGQSGEENRGTRRQFHDKRGRWWRNIIKDVNVWKKKGWIRWKLGKEMRMSTSGKWKRLYTRCGIVPGETKDAKQSGSQAYFNSVSDVPSRPRLLCTSSWPMVNVAGGQISN